MVDDYEDFDLDVGMGKAVCNNDLRRTGVKTHESRDEKIGQDDAGSLYSSSRPLEYLRLFWLFVYFATKLPTPPLFFEKQIFV